MNKNNTYVMITLSWMQIITWVLRYLNKHDDVERANKFHDKWDSWLRDKRLISHAKVLSQVS